MVLKSYIGITGISSYNEAQETLKIYNKFKFNSNTKHILMIGCSLTNKTLEGNSLLNKRYPDFSEIKSIFRLIKNNALTMIHYETTDGEKLSEQVFKIFKDLYDNNICRALQLNVSEPNFNEVKKIKEKLPLLKIVFQLRPEIIKKYSDEEIINLIKLYENSLSYILIDPSCGKGLELNPIESLKFYNLLHINFPNLNLGFAGGLNSDNIKNTIGIIISNLNHSNFSIDAESGLRNKKDELDITKIEKYIQSISNIINSNYLTK